MPSNCSDIIVLALPAPLSFDANPRIRVLKSNPQLSHNCSGNDNNTNRLIVLALGSPSLCGVGTRTTKNLNTRKLKSAQSVIRVVSPYFRKKQEVKIGNDALIRKKYDDKNSVLTKRRKRKQREETDGLCHGVENGRDEIEGLCHGVENGRDEIEGPCHGVENGRDEIEGLCHGVENGRDEIDQGEISCLNLTGSVRVSPYFQKAVGDCKVTVNNDEKQNNEENKMVSEVPVVIRDVKRKQKPSKTKLEDQSYGHIEMNVACAESMQRVSPYFMKPAIRDCGNKNNEKTEKETKRKTEKKTNIGKKARGEILCAEPTAVVRVSPYFKKHVSASATRAKDELIGETYLTDKTVRNSVPKERDDDGNWRGVKKVEQCLVKRALQRSRSLDCPQASADYRILVGNEKQNDLEEKNVASGHNNIVSCVKKKPTKRKKPEDQSYRDIEVNAGCTNDDGNENNENMEKETEKKMDKREVRKKTKCDEDEETKIETETLKKEKRKRKNKEKAHEERVQKLSDENDDVVRLPANVNSPCLVFEAKDEAMHKVAENKLGPDQSFREMKELVYKDDHGSTKTEMLKKVKRERNQKKKKEYEEDEEMETVKKVKKQKKKKITADPDQAEKDANNDVRENIDIGELLSKYAYKCDRKINTEVSGFAEEEKERKKQWRKFALGTLSKAERLAEAYKRRAPDNTWVPPRSPYNLLQEDHAHDPWRVLVICMLLNMTTGSQVKNVLWNFFSLCPNAEAAIAANTLEIERVIQSLGLHKKRARMIQRFSKEYLSDDWTHVTQLHGIGKYGADAYAMFCTGLWHQVKPNDHMLNYYWKFLKLRVIDLRRSEPKVKMEDENA